MIGALTLTLLVDAGLSLLFAAVIVVLAIRSLCRLAAWACGTNPDWLIDLEDPNR